MKSLYPGRWQTAIWAVILFWLAEWHAPDATAQESAVQNLAARVPASHTEVISLSDPASHLDALLSSPALQRAWEQSGLADTMGGTTLSPRSGLDWLQANRQWFPREIVVSSEAGVYDLLGNYFRVMLRMNMSLSLMLNGEPMPDEERVQLERDLQDLASQLEFPHLSVCSEWKDPDMAGQLFGLLVMWARGTAGQMGLELKPAGDNVYLVEGSIGDLIDRESLEQFLGRMTIEQPGPLAEQLIGIEFRIDLQRIGNEVRISLGPETTEWSDPKDFPDAQSSGAEIAWLRWNLQRLKDAGRQLNSDLDYWSDTVTGRTFRSLDFEDVWGTNASVVSQFAMLPQQGQMRVWRQANQLRATIRRQGVQAATDLRNSAVIAKIPGESEVRVISSSYGVGDVARTMLENIENRMAEISLRGDITGDSLRTELSERMIDSYYTHFAGMRVVALEELGVITSSPAGLVINTQGNINLQIKKSHSDATAMTYQTDTFPQFAFVVESDDMASLSVAMEDLYREFVSGIVEMNGLKLPSDAVLVADSKIELPVPAREFQLDWIEGSGIVDLTLDGDFRPHFYLIDNLFVFSTSEKLGRQIAIGQYAVAELPSGDGVLTDFGIVPGRSLGMVYREFLTLFFRSVDYALMAPGSDNPDKRIGEMVPLLQGVVEFASLLTEWRWENWQDGDASQTRMVLDFQYE